MDKKTMLKIFGEAFLRSLVVLLGIMIVGFGAFFLINVNSNNGKVAQETTTENTEDLHAQIEEENANDTTEEITTEAVTTEEITTQEITTQEPTTEELNIPSTDKNIMVLNSTSKAGLAKTWGNKLQNAGFSNIAIGNYNDSAKTQTQIYVTEEGMAKDLVEYFKDAVITVGAVDSSVYVQKGGTTMNQVDIFIVVGTNDTSVQ